jgi:mono/diheme cytochrome c family protein
MNAWWRASLAAALVPLMAAAASCERGHPRANTPSAAADGIVEIASAAALPAVSGQARAEAESLFGERCAVCHGDNGEGNGPGASNLNPKPVNFHNQQWQRSITDERIAKAIVYGGQAVGLSASMAPNPDLESKPEIVAALVERIRKLGK